MRLCKAVRYRYANADMADLEECLKKAQAQRFRIICTDGVFSMDGNAAPLDKICALAEKYDALVMVDECHSAGVLGKTGRGITELYDRRGQVDILTGTLGKAFGGAVGGFTTGRRRSSTCCASVRAPTSSPTRCPRCRRCRDRDVPDARREQ